eukprot:4649932-Pleurochrysis_carterae.AAC.1
MAAMRRVEAEYSVGPDSATETTIALAPCKDNFGLLHFKAAIARDHGLGSRRVRDGETIERKSVMRKR